MPSTSGITRVGAPAHAAPSDYSRHTPRRSAATTSAVGTTTRFGSRSGLHSHSSTHRSSTRWLAIRSTCRKCGSSVAGSSGPNKSASTYIHAACDFHAPHSSPCSAWTIRRTSSTATRRTRSRRSTIIGHTRSSATSDSLTNRPLLFAQPGAHESRAGHIAFSTYPRFTDFFFTTFFFADFFFATGFPSAALPSRASIAS